MSAKTDMNEGPDFLCIGMPKAGTSWLYDQVQHHPDFWMPPLKEFHYLDREFPRMKHILDRLSNARDDPERATKIRSNRKKRALDDLDFRFLELLEANKGAPMEIARYAALFQFKGDLISGDITPSYCTMPEELIARIVAAFPALKVVFLIRDPVARAWSHFAMLHRGGKLETSALEDVDKFRVLLTTSKVVEMGHPAQMAPRWRRKIPQTQLSIVFFDDIQAQPEIARRDVLTFLGADPAKGSGELASGYNRKSDRSKLELTDRIKEVLIEHFKDELRACADEFGGHARNWAASYGFL